MQEYVAALIEAVMEEDHGLEVRFRAEDTLLIVEVVAPDGRQAANSHHWTRLSSDAGRAVGKNLVNAVIRKQAA